MRLIHKTQVQDPAWSKLWSAGQNAPGDASKDKTVGCVRGHRQGRGHGRGRRPRLALSKRHASAAPGEPIFRCFHMPARAGTNLHRYCTDTERTDAPVPVRVHFPRFLGGTRTHDSEGCCIVGFGSPTATRTTRHMNIYNVYMCKRNINAPVPVQATPNRFSHPSGS